jgi:hypothetical protein
MLTKLFGRKSTSDERTEQVTTTLEGDKVALDVKTLPTGFSINPLAKYVEATYSVSDTVVTYTYYDSSGKNTQYETITTTFTTAQDTTFTSAEWS